MDVVRDWKLSKRKSSREHVSFVYSINTSQEIIDNKVACYARYAQGLAFILKDFKNQDYQIIKLASPVRFAARLAGV